MSQLPRSTFVVTDASEIVRVLVGLKDVRVLAYVRRGPDVELVIEQVIDEVRCPGCCGPARVKERPIIRYVDLPVYGTQEGGDGAWWFPEIRNLTSVSIHEMIGIIQIMDREQAPPLLPILRSRQQAELLTLLLGDPDLELSLTELAQRLGIAYPSVHREIGRMEATGLVTSRKIGNTRLVRANPASPYFEGLAQVLTRAFGVPALLADTLRSLEGVTEAYIYGSWAARYVGTEGRRPVEDIDILVLGEPDRDALYAAVAALEPKLGRRTQLTIRPADWLATGDGSFHDTVASHPIIAIPLGARASAR